MPLGRLVGGTLIATALAATMCVGTYWTASAMQSDLVDKAQTTLDAQHLTATVMFSGRDAYVWADTPTARADAIAALKTIPGVRVVLVGEGPAPLTPQSPSAAVTSTRPSTAPSAEAVPTATPPQTGSTPATGAASATSAVASSTAATAAETPVPPATTAPVTIPAWPAVLFDGDSSTVNTAGTAQLVQVARFMVAHPTTTVVLTGYTDTGGTAAGRQALGMARAASAQAVLVAEGVSSSRTTIASGGGSNPVSTSGTSQGRALNRRVTVTMTQES